MSANNQHHVVIIGGGFAGLAAASNFKSNDIKVSLLDKRNFHLFQPLLYQAATGSLSPSDIASPLRAILAKQKNVTVYKAEVTSIDTKLKVVKHDFGEISYDSLIVASGVVQNFFGNDAWEHHATGLKTIEDAFEIRNRVFMALELAEGESDPNRRKSLMRFVIIGSGPTGVELAGSLGELARCTLINDFRNINPLEVEIIMVEGNDRILPPYPPNLSAKAQQSLDKMGIKVLTNTRVVDIQTDHVIVKNGEKEERIDSMTVLWAAGMKASPLAGIIASETGAEQDRMGRIVVNPDLTVPNYPDIYIAGDLANLKDKNGALLPGIAPVAMQQGKYVAEIIKRKLKQQTIEPFNYFDKGTMAVIGRNAAVAKIGSKEISGYFAWLTWVFVHIWYLVGYDNKLLIMIKWAWNYWTDKRGARLITHESAESKQACHEMYSKIHK